MRAGYYISGGGHLLLILVILFGGWFDHELPPVQVAEVSIISEAQYAALTPPAAAPDIKTDTPVVTPPKQEAAPATPKAEPAPKKAAAPPVETPPTPAKEPAVTVPQPVPNAVVEDKAPIINTPPTDIEGSSPVAGVAEPAPRVAPVPEVAPPPLAEVAPDRTEATKPDTTVKADTPPPPEQKAAAPKQASDRVVTEAEKPKTFAPASSMRPRTRPPAPQQVAKADTATPPPPADTAPADPQADAIAAAVASANASTPAETGPARQGPPLTGGEKDAFRIAVSKCWVVDPGAQSAGVKVTVGFSLTKDGKVAGDVKLVDASGGDAASQRAAFDSARRAILRCGAKGFDLPVEKYAEWRDIQMTFNPEGMQFR